MNENVITLMESGVRFEADTHSYWLNGMPLTGVTGLLTRQLFGHKYDDVPAAQLEAAKQRGTRVHSDIYDFDEVGIVYETPEVRGYKALKEQNGWTTVASEYTVTDFTAYASRIDKVLVDESGNIILADAKTTYELDKPYVRWQLSIYAYMFELINPGLKVSRLVGLWLRGENHEAVEVERIPTEEVKRLLECDRMGYTFTPSSDVVKQTDSDTMPALIADNVIDEYIAMTAQVEELTRKLDTVKEAAIEAMKAYGVKKWDAHRIAMTYVAPKESDRLDSARLKAERPDIYEAYTKKVQSKESIRITIRQ